MGGRKIDANICLFKKEFFPKTRFRIVLCFIVLKTFYWSSARLLGKRGFIQKRFTEAPNDCSESAISLKIFIFKNNHSKTPLGKRGPRVRPTHLMCPQFTRGKNPCFFPLAAPLFPSATVGPRSHLWWGRLRADGQKTALSASMACFICPGLFGAARWARFGAWADEKHNKNAYSIKYADLIYCRSVAHAPNLT